MKQQGLLNWLPRLSLGLLLAASDGRGLRAMEVSGEPAGLTEQVPPWPVGPFVILPDGGVLAGRLRELSADRVTIDTVSCGTLDLPRVAVAGYRSSPRVGPLIGGAGNAVVRVALVNGDRIEANTVRCDGQILSLGGLSGSMPTGQPLEIPFDRVLAIDLTADETLPGGFFGDFRGRWVGLADGTRFGCADAADQPARDREGMVSLQPLTEGFVLPLQCPATEIAVVEPPGSRLRLAFVEPVDGLARSEAASLTRGCSFTGDWPRLRGLTGFTAIGLHAPATVTYAFDRPAVRFTATVGIDDTAGQGGSVTVRVAANTAPGNAEQVQPAEGQASEDWLKECFRSPVLRGAEQPVVIDLPLPGITILQLEVQPADGGTVLDRTLWLDPQVIFSAAPAGD